ncbi:MAG: phosphoribosylformylglycinamidine cyclo-ligase [Candidatus Muiribacteriaceae bacterium]
MPTYKDAGVDIKKGENTVRNIKDMVKSTYSDKVLGGLGGFSGLYELPGGFRNPVLVSGTDGVGTKLRMAIDSGILHTIGIDLVAMCVNDIITCGARPMFFLDYMATGNLDEEAFSEIISGICEGCRIAGVSLVGGETAEMPGMYSGDDFDLAGFAVGIVEKERIITGESVQDGDVLLAFPSSGVHSNGYSLVRHIIKSELGMSLRDFFRQDPDMYRRLLEPTAIYAGDVMKILENTEIRSMAHITGGGLADNISRVIPENVDVLIDTSALPEEEAFSFLKKYVNRDEMFRVFNMGAGYVILVSESDVDRLMREYDLFLLGHVVKGSGKVIYE